MAKLGRIRPERLIIVMEHRLIFENWRQFITERNFFGAQMGTGIQAKTQELRKFGTTGVAIDTKGTMVYIYYATLDPKVKDSPLKTNAPYPDRFPTMMSKLNPKTTEDVSQSQSPWGMVAMQKTDDFGNCADGWIIVRTEAKKGWGPLLYDIAIEYATQNGGGLIADRKIVSSAALKVWQIYLTKRKGDIESSQLDRLPPYNTVTPADPTDDCEQTSSIKHGKAEWQKSPLSKIYRKPKPAIMDELDGDNLLRIRGKKA